MDIGKPYRGIAWKVISSNRLPEEMQMYVVQSIYVDHYQL